MTWFYSYVSNSQQLLLSFTKGIHLECSPLEWQILEDVAEFLQPFKVANEYLSGEKYPTISVLGHLLAEILAKVEFTEDDTPTLREVKKVLVTDMHTRYQDRRVTEVLNISSFLDPWLKTFAILTKDVQEKTGDSLKEEMLEHPEVITRRSLKLNPQNAKKPHPSQKLLGTKFRDTSSSSCFSTVAMHDEIIFSKISCYKVEKPAELTENILQWWKVRKDTYPNFSEMATLNAPHCSGRSLRMLLNFSSLSRLPLNIRDPS